MSTLRISFGDLHFKNHLNSKNAIVRDACIEATSILSNIKSLSYEQVTGFDKSDSLYKEIQTKDVVFTTFKEQLTKESCLIVVQVFIKNILFPNYFSLTGFGKLYASGLIFNLDGTIQEAPDDKMYEYW